MKGLIYTFVIAMGLIMASVSASATVTYVYTDPQGTPLAEADASGTITATFDYKPYGSQALGSPEAGPGYTGHVNDPDTGFVYMQARYYDSAVGRFLTTDQVVPSPSSLFFFNRYVYAKDNPLAYADPSGKSPYPLLQNIKDAVYTALFSAAANASNALYEQGKEVVSNEFNTHTYTFQIGGGGAFATPVGPAIAPSVGLNASGGLAINTHGQISATASVGPMAGAGGGLAGGLAYGLTRGQGSGSPVGFSLNYTNHAEVDFNVPDAPITIGLGADWSADGAGLSAGSNRVGAGVIIFAGAGKNANFSYTFNRGNTAEEDKK